MVIFGKACMKFDKGGARTNGNQILLYISALNLFHKKKWQNFIKWECATIIY